MNMEQAIATVNKLGAHLGLDMLQTLEHMAENRHDLWADEVVAFNTICQGLTGLLGPVDQEQATSAVAGTIAQ